MCFCASPAVIVRRHRKREEGSRKISKLNKIQIDDCKKTIETRGASPRTVSHRTRKASLDLSRFSRRTKTFSSALSIFVSEIFPVFTISAQNKSIRNIKHSTPSYIQDTRPLSGPRESPSSSNKEKFLQNFHLAAKSFLFF